MDNFELIPARPPADERAGLAFSEPVSTWSESGAEMALQLIVLNWTTAWS